MLDDSVLPVTPDLAEAVEWVLADVAAPGTWLTGAERVNLAHTARRARVGLDSTAENSFSKAWVDVATTIAVDAAAITSDWVLGLESRGITSLEYVEAVGVVSRVVAIDTYATGVGAEWPELPDPHVGEPTREIVHGAERRRAWVPIDGPAGATTALNSVRAEAEAEERLAGSLYLSYEAMNEAAPERDGLTRAQMELAAARTSYRNDCFY